MVLDRALGGVGPSANLTKNHRLQGDVDCLKCCVLMGLDPWADPRFDKHWELLLARGGPWGSSATAMGSFLTAGWHPSGTYPNMEPS